jgi:hypothetical protein
VLRVYELVAAVRDSSSARDVLGDERLRVRSCDHLGYVLGWTRWLGRRRPEIGVAGIATTVAAQAYFVATWALDPFAEWFPSKTFLRDLLTEGEVLEPLQDEGAMLPDWLL